MTFNLKTAISSIAPTLATMLGGPLAGTAVTALESALGLTSGTGADGVTAAVAAGMTPETIAAVRAADQKHLEVMQQQGLDLDTLNADFAKSMAATDAADRASARTMQVSTKAYTVPALAWTIVCGFIAVTALEMLGQVKTVDQTTHDLINTLRDLVMLVAAFYFGSSHGSAKKDDTIQAQASAAAAQATQ
jgi:hypothetical protein